MKFLLDENFPKTAVAFLTSSGHQAVDFPRNCGRRLKNPEVFQKAQRLSVVLLTTDRDFFHTIPLLYPEHAGVVVVALRQPNRAGIIMRLEWLLGHIPESAFRNRAFQLRDKTCLAFPPIGE